MKRRILSIIVVLALCLSLLPATALAVDVKVDPDLPDNPEGVTVDEVGENEVMVCNYGTVETNEGVILCNYGTVEENYGVILRNKGIVNTNSGEVRYNLGTVDINCANVFHNPKPGIVKENTFGSAVFANSGTVEVNQYFQKDDDGATVTGYGTVYTLDGGTIAEGATDSDRNYYQINLASENIAFDHSAFNSSSAGMTKCAFMGNDSNGKRTVEIIAAPGCSITSVTATDKNSGYKYKSTFSDGVKSCNIPYGSGENLVSGTVTVTATVELDANVPQGALAEVRINSSNTETPRYLTTVDDVIAAFKGAEGDANRDVDIHLMQDVDIGNKVIKCTNSVTRLYCWGHKLTGSGDVVIDVSKSTYSGILHLNDSAVIENTSENGVGIKLTISGSGDSSHIAVNSSCRITGKKNAVEISGSKVNKDPLSFAGLTVSLDGKLLDPKELLEKSSGGGTLLFQRDGEHEAHFFTELNDGRRICGACGEVEGEQCGHENTVTISSGDGTHTLKCLDCGNTVKTENCAYGGEYRHDDTNHWKTCTVCGYENKQAHSWIGGGVFLEGSVTTNYKECYECEYRCESYRVTVSVPENLVYGSTAGKNAEYIIDPAATPEDVDWTLAKTDSGEIVSSGPSLPAGLPAGDYYFDLSITLTENKWALTPYGSVYFTVAPAPLTEDMVTLSPESVTYNGAEQKPAVTVDGLELGTDYTVSYSNNKNAGTATVTVTGKGNYTGEVKKTFSITRAMPELTPPTASDIGYGQKLSGSTLTGGSVVNPYGNATVAGKWSWDSGGTQPAATGDFPVTFTPTDTANYETPESVDVSVTVNPATPEINLTVPAYQVADEDVEVTYTVANPYDANLTDDLPAVTLTCKIGNDTKVIGADGKFHIPDGTEAGTVITVTASTAAVDGKYTGTTRTATVTVTDKTPVEITGVSVQNGTYNGGQQNGYEGTPQAAPYDGTFNLQYTGRNGTSYNSDSAPVNAGSYTVTITLADVSLYIGSRTLDFTIEKASITITADSLTADVGSTRPALTYTVDGLVGGDTLAAEPNLTCDADMDTTGQYPITASGAEVPGGGNYNTEITYVPGTLTVIDPTVHVTGVTLNKTSTTLTVGGSERLTAAIVPSDATDKSVTWASGNTAVATVDASGNVTAVSAGTAAITVTTADGGKTAACTVTVITGSGGGGGGGGYAPSDPGTPTVTVPVSGDENTVRVSASVSGSTATVSSIDTTQIDGVIGGSAQTSMVEIDFTGLDKTIDTVKLPAGAIAEIAAAAQNKSVGGLTVKLSNSEISFNGDALAAIQAQAGSQLTLTVAPARASDLNARQKEAVGSAPVYDLTLQSGGSSITDFRGGYVTVSLPYTLAAGQDPSGVVVWYLDGAGNITPCTTTYDVRNQSVIFTTSHLSLYFVGYDPAAVWANPFSDVAEGAWYYDAVRFVNQNGLMNGYSNGSFGPNDHLSRAMLAQILFNKEGRPVVNYLLQYSDVPEGEWYCEAVRWAASQGIVNGYGNGRFGPGDNITREQLAVMLWRYAGSPAATETELNFADAGKAGAWALDALRWAVENGVISGKGSGILDPAGSATRAEAAQMLKNFLE